jgi:uncharacterized membrane protein
MSLCSLRRFHGNQIQNDSQLVAIKPGSVTKKWQRSSGHYSVVSRYYSMDLYRLVFVVIFVVIILIMVKVKLSLRLLN